jgi:hypothetical protein
MPSPGTETIATEIGNKTYTVEGGFDVEFKTLGDTVQKLSTAINAGWTSAAPTTVTTMAITITAEFTQTAGIGLAFLIALGTGIDAEVTNWAASFNSITSLHTYAPTALTITSAIMAASPIQSAGAIALAEVVSDIFIANFEQEAG